MQVSEDYPGEYTHFCEHHGHFEDMRAPRVSVAMPDPLQPWGW